MLFNKWLNRLAEKQWDLVVAPLTLVLGIWQFIDGLGMQK